MWLSLGQLRSAAICLTLRAAAPQIFFRGLQPVALFDHLGRVVQQALAVDRVTFDRLHRGHAVAPSLSCHHDTRFQAADDVGGILPR